jgi:hypothetical protein
MSVSVSVSVSVRVQAHPFVGFGVVIRRQIPGIFYI